MSWRFVLIRILVNFVAIFLAVLVLPGFDIIDPWLGRPVLDLLVAALILSVLNTFVKPVLQILAGRLTIATLGLFGFIINALMLGLLVWLSPTRWQMNSILTFLLAGALIAALSTVFEAILGVDDRSSKRERAARPTGASSAACPSSGAAGSSRTCAWSRPIISFPVIWPILWSAAHR